MRKIILFIMGLMLNMVPVPGRRRRIFCPLHEFRASVGCSISPNSEISQNRHWHSSDAF